MGRTVRDVRTALRERGAGTKFRRHRRCLVLGWLAGALLGIPGSPAGAQDTSAVVTHAPDRSHAWLGLGLGAGSEGFAGSAHLSYQHGVHLLSLRYAATSGLFEDAFHDVAILYGRTTHTPDSRYRAGVALGVGLADGCAGGGIFSNCSKKPTVVGLPVEAHLAWLPSRWIGLALYGFADFNKVRSFAGLTLGFLVGSFR